MLRQAVYSLLLLGLAQGLPTAAQSAENFSVEGSSASDPTVQLVDLTGVDPDDYDEESLTPALIEKLHEQKLEAEQKNEPTPLFVAPEIIYSEPAQPHPTRPLPVQQPPLSTENAIPSAQPQADTHADAHKAESATSQRTQPAPEAHGIKETIVTPSGITERIEAPTPISGVTLPSAPAPAQSSLISAKKPSDKADSFSTSEPRTPEATASVPNNAKVSSLKVPAASRPQPSDASGPHLQTKPTEAISRYEIVEPLPLASPIKPHPADDLIKAAYEAYEDKNFKKLNALAAQTREHPLGEYVTLWRLVVEGTLASDKSVKDKPKTAKAVKVSSKLAKSFSAFVKQHEGSYLAERARTDWARLAARAHDAKTFRALYHKLAWNKNEPDLLCWNAYFNLQSGAKNALQQAKIQLLHTTNTLGTSCSTLADAVLSKQPSWGWTYTIILLQKKSFSQARQIIERTPQKYLPAPKKTLAAILTNPSSWYKQNRKRLSRYNTKTLLFASLRMLATDIDKAAAIAQRLDGKLSAHTQALLWGRLGYEAVVDQKDDALGYYAKAGQALAMAHQGPVTVAGEVLQAWHVRAALREKDTKRALAAINMLSNRQKKDPAWIYWKGRLLIASGKKSQGEKLLMSLSKRLDFYGLLACDALNIGYYSPKAVMTPSPSQTQYQQFAQNKSLLRAMHFYALDLYSYGHREWNWALGSMNGRTRLDLAQYAGRLGLTHREINTSSSTNEAIFSLRYPTPHRKEIETAAEKAGLPAAWVYGIIRQESRFIPVAKSSAGARGMMQIMPKTGKWIAKRIGIDDYRTSDLNDMQKNLILGSSYLKMVADSVNGNLPLAASSYNAGPSRAQAWRASLPKEVDGAVFTESIPFGETRNYVMQVSANIAAYSRYSTNPMRITDILGTINPQAADPNPLP